MDKFDSWAQARVLSISHTTSSSSLMISIDFLLLQALWTEYVMLLKEGCDLS